MTSAGAPAGPFLSIADIGNRDGGGTVVDSPWRTVTIPDPEREYLALLSYLPLKGYRRSLELLRRARSISSQLGNTPGLIGFTFRAKLLSHRFWTLSAWEDEQALRSFVGRAPHLDAMDRLRPHMGDATFTRWKVSGAAIPLTWNVALARADAERAGERSTLES